MSDIYIVSVETRTSSDETPEQPLMLEAVVEEWSEEGAIGRLEIELKERGYIATQFGTPQLLREVLDDMRTKTSTLQWALQTAKMGRVQWLDNGVLLEDEPDENDQSD